MIVLQVILVCFLHGKTWEEYCAKIASTLEPSLDSYSSALGRNGLDDLIADDDGDAFVVDDALAKSGDNLESVSKNNQNCKAEEEVKSSEAAEGKSSTDDVIKEFVDDVVLNAATQAASSENGDTGGKQVEG